MTNSAEETLPVSATDMITASHASGLPPLDEVIQTAQTAAIAAFAEKGSDYKTPNHEKPKKPETPAKPGWLGFLHKKPDGPRVAAPRPVAPTAPSTAPLRDPLEGLRPSKGELPEEDFRRKLSLTYSTPLNNKTDATTDLQDKV